MSINHIVILGGGSAGWLTAGILAARHLRDLKTQRQITLVESPNVPSIGVGEGTWPSMRNTLSKIGIKEHEFITKCDASFKQGSTFVNWLKTDNKHYHHPFTLPAGYGQTEVSEILSNVINTPQDQADFARKTCFQTGLFSSHQAPKQISTPEYGFVANYGYHLDAVKFATLLQKHCTEQLGVRHVSGNVEQIATHPNGDIQHLITTDGQQIAGDLFVDCTGMQAELIGHHYNIPLHNCADVLFNNSALAVQMPYDEPNAPIASTTLSVAQKNGWIWDIGLQSRRGIGMVYCSRYCSDSVAEQQLTDYIAATTKGNSATPTLRKLSFTPGYRKTLWHRNCVAIGLSGGFIEPLEASALALIEQSAKMLSEQLPATREIMDIVAKKFNRRMNQHWEHIIQFLKLHYVLSQRTEPYWRANREADTIPNELQEQLRLWQYQAPSLNDINITEPLFSAASYQYVLYGMNFNTANLPQNQSVNVHKRTENVLHENDRKQRQLKSALPENRDLLNAIRQHGLCEV